jgi:serine phosphatase RsbU (regulator of sigma subunit)
VLIANNEEIQVLDEPSLPVGIYRDTRPLICEIALEPGLTLVMYTDGLVHAGSRIGQPMDVRMILQAMLDSEDPSPQLIADALLDHALKLDQGRPSDDITVVVLRVTSHTGDSVRRMMIRLPLGI